MPSHHASAPPILAELHPLTLGQIIDQAIALYRRNFFTFIGIVAVVQIPLALLVFLINTLPIERFVDGDMLGYNFAIWAPPALLLSRTLVINLASMVLVQGLGYGAIAQALVDYRLGCRTGILAAYRSILPHSLRLVAVMLLGFGLLVATIAWWVLVPIIGWFTGLGMLVFAWAALLRMLAVVVVLEQRPAGAALRRAWDLARRRFWAVLGFALTTLLLGLVAVIGPVRLIAMLLSLGLYELPWLGSAWRLDEVIQIFAGALGNILFMPITAAAYTLMYLDLRVRTEGLDLALQTTTPAAGSLDISALAAAAPAAASERLLTGKEQGYFFALTFGAVGLYFISILALMSLARAVFGPGFD